MFRKVLFTLDGVLHDVTNGEVRVDQIVKSEFVTRWVSSLGAFHEPLTLKDLAGVEWNAFLYPFRAWKRKRMALPGPDSIGSAQGAAGATY